jgi:hypothetical protein
MLVINISNGNDGDRSKPAYQSTVKSFATCDGLEYRRRHRPMPNAQCSTAAVKFPRRQIFPIHIFPT